jgi:hypothetical protein
MSRECVRARETSTWWRNRLDGPIEMRRETEEASRCFSDVGRALAVVCLLPQSFWPLFGHRVYVMGMCDHVRHQMVRRNSVVWLIFQRAVQGGEVGREFWQLLFLSCFVR